ncbi:MAG: DcaP family trimeric outer membrane transporter [Cyclobacteriaceae bacterium]
MKSVIYCLAWIATFSVISFAAIGQTTPEEETQFSIYGFGRTNFVWDNQDLSRSDLFVPANIKINQTRTPNFFIGAKQSRLGLDVKQPVGGESLAIRVEGDFHNDASDATGLFRMRLAYAEYRFVMVGMAYSNFYDLEINPSMVDFEGPNSSTFSRTPQIRFSTYKSKNVLSLSFENPIEKLTLSSSVTALPERFPDIIGAYRINGDFGFVKVAALFREVRYQSDKARSLPSYGATVMGSIKTGSKDRFTFQAVMGTGISKYIEGAGGLNYDAIFNGTNELEALQMLSGFVSYQHFWKDHMHSTVTAGLLNAEDNSNLAATNYQSGYYGSINLFWDAIKNLTFGVESLLGQRVNVNDEKGSALRLEMNATYKFNKSLK